MKRFILGVFMSGMVVVASVLPKYKSITLENKMQVVVVPIKNNTGVIQTNVIYKVGSRNEIMGKSGIAHMLEHMSFKSTKNMKSGEFDKIVKRMGAVGNAATSFDYTTYYIRSSADKLDTSLKLFSDMMQNLSLKDEEFQPERDVVMQERLWRVENSPQGYLFFRFFNTAFIYHPYHWTPIGFIQDIRDWSIQDIREFYKMYYQPQNAVLLVTGDIDPENVFSLAKKHFENINNNKCDVPKVRAVEPKQDGERIVHIKKDTGGNELMVMGFKTDKMGGNDDIALDAISYILGSGKSSIMYKLLVDDLKLAYNVDVFNMSLRDNGVVMIFTQANEGIDSQQIKDAILKQIQKIKKDGIEQIYMEKLKANVKFNLIKSLADSGSVSVLFTSYLATDNLDYLFSIESKMDGLDSKKIKDVMNKYFDTNNLTTLFMKK